MLECCYSLVPLKKYIQNLEMKHSIFFEGIPADCVDCRFLCDLK